MKTIAIVPCRMGSERVKNKNLRIVGTNSIIGHTLDCASRSSRLDRVVLTSDSYELSTMANAYSALFLQQPSVISGPKSDISEVVTWALPLLPKSDLVVVLQPAVLARSPKIIDDLVGFVADNRLSGGLTMAASHPWIWTATGSWLHSSWDFENYPRSQTMPKTLCEINSVQITTSDIAMSGRRWKKPIGILELPSWSQMLDIDTEEDLAMVAKTARHLLPMLEEWSGPMHIYNEVGQCE